MKHTPGPWYAINFGGYMMICTPDLYDDSDFSKAIDNAMRLILKARSIA